MATLARAAVTPLADAGLALLPALTSIGALTSLPHLGPTAALGAVARDIAALIARLRHLASALTARHPKLYGFTRCVERGVKSGV